MQHDADHDFCRRALARQVLDECERRGLRVWQQYGAAYIARPAHGRLVPAPKHWRRIVAALSYEIACLLDWDCGWGCTVERLPGSGCLLYRPERWFRSSSLIAIGLATTRRGQGLIGSAPIALLTIAPEHPCLAQ
jgi:hypothetical protein